VKDFVRHEEEFDGYTALITGYKPKFRLSIFRDGSGRDSIVYQADAEGNKPVKRLRGKISDFRYALTEGVYENLDTKDIIF